MEIADISYTENSINQRVTISNRQVDIRPRDGSKGNKGLSTNQSH